MIRKVTKFICSDEMEFHVEDYAIAHEKDLNIQAAMAPLAKKLRHDMTDRGTEADLIYHLISILRDMAEIYHKFYGELRDNPHE